MSDLDLLKDILRRSTELYRQGDHAEGLKFVETWIKSRTGKADYLR
jgi:hypothetical protein